MSRTYLYIIILFSLLVSCYSAEDSSIVADATPDNNVELVNDEETTISVPLPLHEFRIFRQNSEIAESMLSDKNVKELESWWDSLPKPIQKQIQSNQVDIEVVSSITSTNKSNLNPHLNDSQIEKTGETLEQIIGANPEMKYTVSTTLIENQNKDKVDEHTTDIRLVKQVPVKLSTFTADLFMRENFVNNDNIRTVQYWWANLPTEIQDKIKSRELMVDMTCYTIDDGMDLGDNQLLAESADENIAILSDVLNRIVGVYRVGSKEKSIAKINISVEKEVASEKNSNYPAKQYIKLNLRKNKDYLPTL